MKFLVKAKPPVTAQTQEPTSRRKRKSTSPSSCTLTFIILIVLLSAVTCLALRQGVYKRNTHFIKGSGQVSARGVSSDLNTLMCSSYDVEPWKAADVFLVPGTATVSLQKRTTVKRNVSELVPGSSDLRNAFYLLEFSTIKVNACLTDPAVENTEILIFKGDQSWNDWQTGSCSSCVAAHKRVFGQTQSILNFDVFSRDTYYVAVTDSSDRNVKYIPVKGEMDIQRTSFDTTHAKQVCHGTLDCVLNLTFSSEEDVILSFNDNFEYSTFSSQCGSRFMFWVGLFLIFPLFMIMLVLLCHCVTAVCITSGESREENMGLLQTKQNVTQSNCHRPLTQSVPGYDSTAHAGSIQVV